MKDTETASWNCASDHRQESCEKLLERYGACILSDENVQRMDEFCQHGKVSTLEHSKSVALTSLKIAEALHLNVDAENLIAGALLHDFYLYDWHEPQPDKPSHATRHPLYAAQNAREHIGINDEVRHVIESHMWPLPPNRIPTTKEAWLVCIADKYCSFKETLFMRK